MDACGNWIEGIGRLDVFSLSHSFLQHLPNHLTRVMNWMEYTPIRFVAGSKLRRTANILEVMAAIQRDFLEQWAHSSLMSSRTNANPRTLFARKRPLKQYRQVWGRVLYNSPWRSWQTLIWAWDNSLLWQWRQPTASQTLWHSLSVKEVIISMCTVLTGLPYPLSSCPVWAGTCTFFQSRRHIYTGLSLAHIIGRVTFASSGEAEGSWVSSSWSRDDFRRRQQPSAPTGRASRRCKAKGQDKRQQALSEITKIWSDIRKKTVPWWGHV